MLHIRANIFILGLIISIPLRASSSFDKNWSLSSEMDNVKVWQLKADSDVTGSWQEKKPLKKLDWSKVGTESFFKKFEADKIKMLSFVGIRDWKAHKYQWSKLPLGHELKIEGHYVDATDKKIAFTELHYFQEHKTIQILQTRPWSVAENHAEEFFQFINNQVQK